MVRAMQIYNVLEKQKDCFNQGYNAKKNISEVKASFVLQCTVSGW